MNKNPYFLEKVATRVLELLNNEQSCAIILPNRRAGMYLKKHMAKSINKPIFLPDILTIEDYLTDLSGLIRADSIQQLLYLFEAYEEMAIGDDTFDKFLSWAPTFIKDCNDIDNSLVDPALFFKELFEDRKIRNWNLEGELTQMQEKYLDFWRQAHYLYLCFTQKMKQEGKAYMGLIYKIALEKLKELQISQYDKILFVGFNALNEAEKALFDICIEKEIGEVWWDMDGYYVSDDIQKAGRYFREYAPAWNIDISEISTDLGFQLQDIYIREAPNNTSQCDLVYKILKEVDIHQNDLSKTAIILPDELLLDPLLLRLPEEIDYYNITMGKSLDQFAEYHLFDNIFNLFEERSEQGFRVQSLIGLSASPFFKHLDTASEFPRMLSHIRKNNSFILKHEDAAQYKSGIWKLLFNTKSDVLSILSCMQSMIYKLRNHFMQIKDRKSVEVLFEFHNIFVQLQNVVKENTSILTLSSIRRFYKQIAKQTKLPFEGEPLEGVQIMGLLESRCLDFEHVILLSANEGSLPESKNTQTFIPHVFREYFKMPTYNERDAIFAYSFYRLFHQAKRVDIIYNGSSGALSSGEKSRYVQQLESEYPQKVQRPTTFHHVNSYLKTNKLEAFNYHIDKSKEVLQDIQLFIKNKSFSPSSLNQLIASPLDFYFAKIVGIKEPQLLEIEMENNTFGSIVHDTLEDIYKPFQGKVLTDEILDIILKSYKQALAIQFEKVFKNGNIESGYNKLLWNAAEIMIEETISLDRQRIKKHTIRIIELERPLESKMSIPLDEEHSIIIQLTGRADRLQQCDDWIEIIDYKTGSIDELTEGKLRDAGWNFERDKYVQLLMYAYMLANPAEGNGYDIEKLRPALQGLRSWQKGLTFIHNAQFVITNEHIERLKKNLGNHFAQLLDPDYPFEPEENDKRTHFSVYKDIYQLK